MPVCTHPSVAFALRDMIAMAATFASREIDLGKRAVACLLFQADLGEQQMQILHIHHRVESSGKASHR